MSINTIRNSVNSLKIWYLCLFLIPWVFLLIPMGMCKCLRVLLSWEPLYKSNVSSHSLFICLFYCNIYPILTIMCIVRIMRKGRICWGSFLKGFVFSCVWWPRLSILQAWLNWSSLRFTYLCYTQTSQLKKKYLYPFLMIRFLS